VPWDLGEFVDGGDALVLAIKVTPGQRRWAYRRLAE
jgi:hypothetical protein